MLFGLLLLTAVLTAFVRELLVSVVAFAAYSLAMTLVWVRYQAPDVALTEAAVGAGVTTVLFLAVIARTSNGVATSTSTSGGPHSAPMRWPAAVVATVFGAGIFVTVRSFPPVGAGETPVHQYLAAEYLLSAPIETGISNVVTAILVVYRGFDTFGEAVVVLMSAIAVLLILRQEGIR